jgi:hypothetical protein
MPTLNHVRVKINGREEIWAEEISFDEESEHILRRFPGATVVERSALAPQATVSMTVGIPSSGAITYRLMLRRGSEVNVIVLGADGYNHIITGIVQSCSESDPKTTGHNMTVTISGTVRYPV